MASDLSTHIPQKFYGSFVVDGLPLGGSAAMSGEINVRLQCRVRTDIVAQQQQRQNQQHQQHQQQLWGEDRGQALQNKEVNGIACDGRPC